MNKWESNMGWKMMERQNLSVKRRVTYVSASFTMRTSPYASVYVSLSVWS